MDAYVAIDKVYEKYIEDHPQMPSRWLLAQTLHTAAARRTIVGLLPVRKEDQVLDIGAGFGAMSIDIAIRESSATITALDVDQHVLEHARAIYDSWCTEYDVNGKSSVRFVEGDIYELPFGSESFDFVVARYVYQHLTDPARATSEIYRVLRPGGHVCLIDVDDQFTITYPALETGFEKLQSVWQTVQGSAGGDRFVGRKLAHYLVQVGFRVIGTLVHAESQFGSVDQNETSLHWTKERLSELRQQMIDSGCISESEYDFSISSFEAESKTAQFHATGQIVVLGQK